MNLPPIIFAKFIRREKRFLSYHQLPNGEEVVAHCANPGSMRGNLLPGAKVWLQDFGPDYLKSRKLRYRWIAIEAPSGPVCIDTSIGNILAAEALREGLIPELAGYSDIQAEVTVGDSRFDFCLRKGIELKYLEVKSVSMAEPPLALFPDSPTLRGQKHMRGLQELAQNGMKAAVLFIVMRSDCTSFSAAKEIDPKYALALAEAAAAGVEVWVYDIAMAPEQLRIRKKLAWR